MAERNGVFGAAVDVALLARLDLKVGDRIDGRQGADRDPRGACAANPTSSPAASASARGCSSRIDALRATGLLQPGSLVRWIVSRPARPERRRRPARQGDDRPMRRSSSRRPAGKSARATMPRPQLERNIERFTQFLTLVGLTALAGRRRRRRQCGARASRPPAATPSPRMKSLGATGGRVFVIYLMQVMVIAAIGTAIGLVIGAALPFVIALRVRRRSCRCRSSRPCNPRSSRSPPLFGVADRARLRAVAARPRA